MNKCYFILLISVLCVSCSPTNKTSNEINIYSQRHYSVDEIQYKNFEKLTGIKVNVVKVNIVNQKSKMKLRQGKKTYKSGYKKAIITLKKGQSIDLATGI